MARYPDPNLPEHDRVTHDRGGKWLFALLALAVVVALVWWGARAGDRAEIGAPTDAETVVATPDETAAGPAEATAGVGVEEGIAPIDEGVGPQPGVDETTSTEPDRVAEVDDEGDAGTR